MEQNFPEFPEKEDNLVRYTEIFGKSCRLFSFHLNFFPELVLEFSVELFAFENSWIFWKPFLGNFRAI